ncbi:MAG TPA: HD domain-containing phosphohydrolase [Thermoanaerobaculia bacterium]|nr:HD domain-containing phosphohydrolase [Thermoanaerobaculia bacterium]
MSIITRDTPAAPVTSGAAFTYRRSHPVAVWLGRGRGVRLLVSLLAGFLGEILAGWGVTAPFIPLPLTPFVSFASGVLFGWQGLLGSMVGQLAAVSILQQSVLPAVVFAASYSLTGLAGWLAFQRVPGLGRGLPNLRSFLAVLASAVAGGLLGSLVVALFQAAPLALRLWNGTTGSVMSVLLLAPPMLLAMDRFWRRWMVPIRNEVPVHGSREEAESFATGVETVILEMPSRTRGMKEVLQGAGMILAATALAVPVTRWLPDGAGWITFLYLGPILWAALNHGLRGGILAASGSGLGYLLGLSFMEAALGPAHGPGPLWANRGDLLILSLAAALVGWTREREIRLRDELMDTNRLLRRDLLRVARALTQAVEAKDAYTEGHLRRVSEYAVAVGEKLGLRGQDLETLHYASMLHDVGKLGIPEEILRKEGPLDAGEVDLMRRHPEIGARMLEKLDLLNEAAPLVLHHQERFDGMRSGRHPGYPGGLAGDSIPLGARIIAVVDAFDAMTTTRPYRQAFTTEEAVNIIRNERGKQFDPRVVDAFLDCLVERPWHRS